MSENTKERIRRFQRKHGEPLILSAMVAFFISTGIVQVPEWITPGTVVLLLALWTYTVFVFAFVAFVWVFIE